MRQWTVYSSLAVYPIFLANLAHGGVLTTSIAAHPADATILGEAGEGEAPIYISAHSAEDRGPILSDSESKARQAPTVLVTAPTLAVVRRARWERRSGNRESSSLSESVQNLDSRTKT